MKLICLNIWGGHVDPAWRDFVVKHRDVDVFCLQEVYRGAEEKISTENRKVQLDLFFDLGKLLPEHEGYFRPVVDGVYGVAMFVKKGIKVCEEGEILIHDNPEYTGRGPKHKRNMQWVRCVEEEKEYFIMNVHGLWNGQGKTDTDERIAQSVAIKEFVDGIAGARVLCGDFNLRPETESMRILEVGMDNLIKKNGVKTTRTSLYGKPEPYADYVFTCPDVEVRDFKVLGDEVSDHSPLFVEFD